MGAAAGAGEMADMEGHGDSGSSTDLTTGAVRARSDGDLYGVITDGLGGTEMPAYDIALTDDQRWEIVAHIRRLQDEARNVARSQTSARLTEVCVGSRRHPVRGSTGEARAQTTAQEHWNRLQVVRLVEPSACERWSSA